MRGGLVMFLFCCLKVASGVHTKDSALQLISSHYENPGSKDKELLLLIQSPEFDKLSDSLQCAVLKTKTRSSMALDKFSHAIASLSLLEEYSSIQSDPKQKVEVLSLWAESHVNAGNFLTAEKYALELIEMAGKQNDPIHLQIGQTVLGHVYFSLYRYKEAKSVYLYMLSQSTSPVSKHILGFIYGNMSEIYRMEHHFDSAAYFRKKELALFEEMGDTIGIILVYSEEILDYYREGMILAMKSQIREFDKLYNLLPYKSKQEAYARFLVDGLRASAEGNHDSAAYMLIQASNILKEFNQLTTCFLIYNELEIIAFKSKNESLLRKIQEEQEDILLTLANYTDGAVENLEVAQYIHELTGGKNRREGKGQLYILIIGFSLILIIATGAIWVQYKKSASKENRHATGFQFKHNLNSQLLFSELLMLVEIDKIHLNSSVNLNQLSKRLGTNDTYLSQTINTMTGLSFSRFINYFRIADSRKMLCISDKSIKEISEECGFNSIQTFYRAFKEECRTTPRKYRALTNKEDLEEPIDEMS